MLAELKSTKVDTNVKLRCKKCEHDRSIIHTVEINGRTHEDICAMCLPTMLYVALSEEDLDDVSSK